MSYNKIKDKEVAKIEKDGSTLKLYDKNGNWIADRGVHTCVKALVEKEKGEMAESVTRRRF